ncbi:MAG: GNAT family N-acetyltransferase [Candidatus Izemoplasma sp.]
MLTKATRNDLIELDNIAERTIAFMKESKIPQWDYDYPRLIHFELDINKNALYIYKEQGHIIGFGVILPENDLPYKTIDGWLKKKSLVIHRMMTDPQHINKGVAQMIIDQAVEIGINEGYESIKIDTHLDNYKMRQFLEKNNFIEIGYLEVINRVAYEKVLEDYNE